MTPPHFDFRFYKSSAAIIGVLFICYFLGNYILPICGGLTVTLIEHLQSLTVIVMIGYVYFANKRNITDIERYRFWLWTLLWWLLILGRGISWGRDFFPEVPRIIYKCIGGLLIALPLLSMFLPTIRREIVCRYKYEKIPVWSIFLMFISFALVDVVEHHRIGYNLFVISRERQDLVEELFEMPFYFSLILSVCYLMRNEKNVLS